MIALGLDIGASSVKAALLRDGSTVALSRSAAYERPDAEGIAAALRECVDALGLPPDEAPEAVGLCVPGVREPGSTVVLASLNLPGLVGADLRDLAARALGVAPGSLRLTVTTDAHAAAIDVQRSRGIAGRLLAISLGTGVGACVLDDGQPLRVTGEGPGHIGQIDVTLDDAPPKGADGSLGTLEAYIGLRAVAHRLGPDPEKIGAALTPDDPGVRALIRAVRICHAIYRPDEVCLLGGVGIALRRLLAVLHDRIADGLTSLARPGWRLTAGDDLHHAARGAARMACDEGVWESGA
ncbi:MAG: ROK family protein [Phycisphaeraceae bacterium]|nr:ROK family protein [Phycisphaeraceae bacterium]